ncbi:hypothetical protein V1512DRAFT_259468 [Lipomyces arxii]|uniref:uncharacterized protein n=1 Tax=Lipomyces arxii TaxID=56418 RepID=UPI0034CE7B7C
MSIIEARRQSASALASAIESSSSTPGSAVKRDVASIGAAIEQALYTINDSTLNRNVLREKVLNLKHNPVLAERLVRGELSPAEFAGMTSAQMASAERAEEVRELERENLMQHLTTDGRMPVPVGRPRSESVTGDISALEAYLAREGETDRVRDDEMDLEDH